MKEPGWRAERVGGKPSGRPHALRARPALRRARPASVRAVTPDHARDGRPLAVRSPIPAGRPSGARLAWVDSYDGRVRPRRRARPTASAPPVVVTADAGVGGGYVLGRATTSSSSRRGDGRLVVVARRRRRRPGARRATAAALAPAVSARGEVAFAIERDDACDVAIVPLDGSAWPSARLARRLRVGPGLVARRHAARVARVGPARHAVGRVAHRRARRRRRGEGRRRRRRGRRRAAALLARRATARVRLRRRGLADRVDRRSRRRRTRSRCSPSTHEHAEPAWGPGQRSYAWSPDGNELAWCRNEDGFGRLVIARAGHALGARAVEGLAPRARLGRRRHRVRAVGRGDARPGRRARGQRVGPARRSRADRSAGSRRRALVEPRAVTWKSGSATVHGCCCTGRPTAATPPLVVHVHGGPTGRRSPTGTPRVQWLVAARLRRAAAELPRLDGLRARVRAGARGRWGERDVADVAAGIRHAVKEGWCDPAARRADGRQRGRDHRVARRGAAPRSRPRRRSRCTRSPISLDLAATTHRFESGYHLRLVGPLPDAAERYRERSPVTRRRRDPRAGAAAPRQRRPIGAARSSRTAATLRAAGTRSSATCTRAKATAGAAPRPSPTSSTRIDAFLTRDALA